MELPAPNHFSTIEEFLSGSLLIIDKPLGWTSFSHWAGQVLM